MDGISVTTGAFGAVPADSTFMSARNHMIARPAAPARSAGVRLTNRNARLRYFVAFGDEENEVDGHTYDQWRVRKELIERTR